MNGSGSFASIVKKLETWFNKKLSEEQFNLFAKRLYFIPERVLGEIVDRIINDNPPTPARFPTVQKMLDGWYLWKREHPNMIVKHQRQDCPDCNGVGFLWFEMYDSETEGLYEFVARCGSCENWRIDCNHLSPIPIRVRADLESKGMKVHDSQPDHVTNRNMKAVAGNLLESV